MAIIIPKCLADGYSVPACEWTTATTCLDMMKFQADDIAGNDYNHYLEFAGLVYNRKCGTNTIGATYLTVAAGQLTLDIWKALRNGLWSSSVAITHKTVSRNSSTPIGGVDLFRCYIQNQYPTCVYADAIVGTGVAITCVSAFTNTHVVTVYDDGSITYT